jgi:hypothetical protein
MQVVDRVANLSEFRCCFLLLHFLRVFNQFIECTLLHILHHDVEVKGVVEEPVELDHVAVVEEETDLHLLDELLEHQSH